MYNWASYKINWWCLDFVGETQDCASVTNSIFIKSTSFFFFLNWKLNNKIKDIEDI